MKPIKNFESISKWILRFALAAYVICSYFIEIKTFEFKSLNYIVNLIFLLSTVLLLLGGVSKNSTLTVVSGLIISIIAIYKTYVAFAESGFTFPAPYVCLIILGIGLFFTSKGNS